MFLTRNRAIATLALVALFSAAPSPALAQSADKEPARTIKEWDLDKKSLALDGYDPVAYFPEAGGKATKGKKDITHAHKGVTYRFKTEANRELFKKNPQRYEPAYGGWCAWAMLDGGKTEADPKTFIVENDRLFVFYNGFFGNTKSDWEKGDHDSQETRSDGSWKKISGETTPKPEDRKAPEEN